MLEVLLLFNVHGHLIYYGSTCPTMLIIQQCHVTLPCFAWLMVFLDTNMIWV